MSDAAPATPPPPAAQAGSPEPREAVPCPLCEYDLRGLAEPRCPECGYRFVWADLADPAKRRHPYLFEHYPERNLWSFRRTLLGGLWPKKFWTSIHPAQRSRPLRLLLYWLAAASILFVVLAGHYALYFKQQEAATRVRRAGTAKMYAPGTRWGNHIASQYGSVNNWLDQTDPLPPQPEFYRRAWNEEGQWAIYLAALWLAWPWLTLLTLLLFRISMRRARIRVAHVLRCVLYSFDVVLWLGLATALALGVRVLAWYGLAPPYTDPPPAPIPRDHPFEYRSDVVPDTLFWAGLLLLPLALYRLASAFRHYLRFDHPVATVLVAQAIAVLLVIVVALNWYTG